ncbi:MAG: O-antigen ligase family protein [Phycisphaerae bacterium]|nr:O-antigen ligase family protein [Phycisphaerae bacterium]
MTRRVGRCLVALIVFANGAATVLYSGDGPVNRPVEAGETAETTVLRGIADFLTLPIPTSGITDVRDIALLCSLGLALLVVGASPSTATSSKATSTTGAHGCLKPGTSPGPAAAFANPIDTWISYSAFGVTALALLSAAANGTFDLSWGWIVRFVAGVGWTLLIARTFTPGMVRQALTALLILALCCMTLAIADRANRDLAHFQWPVGPITITAALAAVWATLAGGWTAGQAFFRRLRPTSVVLVLTCIVGVYVLEQTGRRAPAAASIATCLIIGVLLLCIRYRSRVLGVVVVGLFLVLVVAGTTYVATQLKNLSREVSGPVALRLAYWELSGGLIAAHPLLGFGPDTFVVEMTNAVAPLRAESPHFFHGNVNLYAHNEWIQAAVELGIPAAVAYLALPMGAIYLAVRHLRKEATAEKRHMGADNRPVRDPSPTNSAAAVALIAGLTAIIITECASITLRTPMMPPWYWTLLGLLAASCRTTRRGGTTAARMHVSRSWARPILVLSAITCIGVSAADLNRAVATARQRRGPDGRFPSRLYADKTVPARYDAAILASHEAHTAPQLQRIEAARAMWHDLYETIPALHDVPAMYADVLILAGETGAARDVLENALSSRLNPYNVAANTLYADLLTNAPVERLRCVQRALRSGSLDSPLQRILIETSGDPAVIAFLKRNLPDARAAATGSSDESSAEPIVELLRIDAFLKRRAGQPQEAIADQRLAAEFYRRLERQQSRYRRPHDAEVDAFLTLARMLYEADRAHYKEAYDAVIAAEYYAVLGIMHEYRANPQPEHGFVWGVVIPTEFPERLHPLWRLSALLHVMVGSDVYLDGRIRSYLPPDRQTAADLNAELARLARQAYDDLSRIPAAERPAHYGALPGMARRYAPASPSPTTAPASEVPRP